MWHEKASGNANVVYSNGSGSVLRVAKSDTVDTSFQLDYSKLISQLISNKSVFESAVLVDMSTVTLEHKLFDTPRNKFGIMMDNVTTALSIELKPKSAVLDLINSINPCLYCLYANKQQELSEYCPFKLFNEDTITQGLKELVLNKKKHLMVHVEGNHPKRFEDAIQLGLVDFEYLENIKLALLDSKVLQSIKRAQQQFIHDIKDIYPLFLNLKSRANPSIDDIKTIVNLKKNDLNDKQKVISYLISKTLRDLSLLITFQNSNFERDNAIKGKLKNGLFYTIDVIDLDFKAIKNISKYYQDAVDAYECSKNLSGRYCQLKR